MVHKFDVIFVALLKNISFFAKLYINMEYSDFV